MRGGRCATVEPFSYSDREASIRALHGVQTLFMVSASESADRLNQHRAVINAAAEAGVNHVVYTSFAAAAPDATFTLARDHYVTEEALTLDEVAATISRVRGTTVTFHNETLDEAYASRAPYGAPEWQVDAWVSTYTAIASNVMAEVSGDVEAITGTPPRSFETFRRETA